MPSRLRRVLAPRAIAVVGASARPGSFGERLALEALRSPAAPAVHLVHPSYDQVQGRPCLPGLTALEHAVDLVLLGIPDPALVGQVRLARERGDGGAVVFGSAHGLGPQIRAAAGDMPVLGPGCMGFVNVAEGVRAIGYLEPPDLEPGPIALVTHSGSVFSALLRTHRRLEYSLIVSSGQEIGITAADCVHQALDLPQTRVVGLVLETLRDAPALRSALARAAAEGVPVVLLALGSSPLGGLLVGAHSGALAGTDGAWEALCRAHGVCRVRDLDELVDTLELFSLRTRPVRPTGALATIHDSGGERAMTADLAQRLGVRFADLDVGTRSTLAGVLDPGLEPGNPLDVWGTGAATRELIATCLRALAADPAVGVTALAVDLVEELDGDDAYPRAVLDAAADAPVVVLAPTAAAVHQPTATLLRAHGVPVLEGLRSGLVALGHWLSPPVWPAAPSAVPPEPPTRPMTRPWDTALELVAAAGVPVVPTRRVKSATAAAAAAADLGHPVVLKADVSHKSDAGGVRLGLGDQVEVRAAYDDLARLGAEVLVQATVPSGVELALGVVRDPQLGPLVVLGLGGTLVELLAERVVALPPLSEQHADELLAELPRVERLLAGVRGAPAADRAAVVSVVAALSRLAAALPDNVAALDVNPLICGPGGAVAVDALVVPQEAPGLP